jgi:hypothetical protein
MAKWVGKEGEKLQYCPILQASRPDNDARCREGDCAWWIIRGSTGRLLRGMCSIKSIASSRL